MFDGCTKVSMDINSEEFEYDGHTEHFDYLFHFPTSIDIRMLDSSIYSGINLVGEIHPNVFGGLIDELNDYHIVKFNVIDGPFRGCVGNHITCNLSSM
jgi:hypothetical protein